MVPVAAPSVSIVVPVFNEVPTIDRDSFTPRIHALTELLRPCDEIILVDGGSSDASWQTLQSLAVHLQITAIQSQKGRARQMNCGAATAKGDILLFLHADSVLNAAAWNGFSQALQARGGQSVWGRFNVRISGQSRWLPVVAWFMNHRSRFSKISTGDQALFASRLLFEKVGGFPEQPLMEDIEWSKRLKQVAAPCFLPIDTPVITSGRRWDTQGAWKTILLMWRFRYQYWRGVPATEPGAAVCRCARKDPFDRGCFCEVSTGRACKNQAGAYVGR